MLRARKGWWAVVVLTALAGCANRPELGPPGPMRQQQLRASVFDPYADNEVGPPVVGNRPRDYQDPASENERSRVFWQNYRAMPR